MFLSARLLASISKARARLRHAKIGKQTAYQTPISHYHKTINMHTSHANKKNLNLDNNLGVYLTVYLFPCRRLLMNLRITGFILDWIDCATWLPYRIWYRHRRRPRPRCWRWTLVDGVSRRRIQLASGVHQHIDVVRARHAQRIGAWYIGGGRQDIVGVHDIIIDADKI